VQWMERNTETFTQMGGEGVPWSAISKYCDETHRFVNLGDGTYFHSGLLAIRQSVSANVNVTYKILFNDAVAMTGGQAVDGELSPEQISHQLYQEKVNPIYLVSDNLDIFAKQNFAPNTIIKHRDSIDEIMLTLREIKGCSAIIYVQTCAAELRRRRKRNLIKDPQIRLFIHPEICEGCGDCSSQSNCIALEPLETEMGRKRTINQSSCNKDLSCNKGFCPSFVTMYGGDLKKQNRHKKPDIKKLPDPNYIADSPTKVWNILVTGVGGTGILTLGALLGMASHIEHKNPLILDMAGLAQKGGAVLSHIKISTATKNTSPNIPNGGSDVLLAADEVVAASLDAIPLLDKNRTHAVVNQHLIPTSDFTFKRDYDPHTKDTRQAIISNVKPMPDFHDFNTLSAQLLGDEITTGMIMLGFAWQKGLIPLKCESIIKAIQLNNIAVSSNIDAFNWGRVYQHDPKKVIRLLSKDTKVKNQDQMTLEEIITHRSDLLQNYQDKNLKKRYLKQLEHAKTTLHTKAELTLDEKNELTRIIAINYCNVLYYKDEYEVARLFAKTDWLEKIKQNMSGDIKIAFNLAPPLLSHKTHDGRPIKRQFGQSSLYLFNLLSKIKFLRGTKFDILGYSEERKAERALIIQFEQDLSDCLCKISKHNRQQYIE
ncbi:MAG: DUF6537 domain-containing protein, partial [Pseudomonadota bacterium]